MSAGKSSRQQYDLEYIVLEDFTPGIFNEIRSDGTGAAPDGAAAIAAGIMPTEPDWVTEGCYASPTGGLAPLPAKVGFMVDAAKELDSTTSRWPAGRMEQVILATEIISPARVSKYAPYDNSPDQLHVLYGWWHANNEGSSRKSLNILWSRYDMFNSSGSYSAYYAKQVVYSRRDAIPQDFTDVGNYPFPSGSLAKAAVYGDPDSSGSNYIPVPCVIAGFGDGWTSENDGAAAGTSTTPRRVLQGIWRLYGPNSDGGSPDPTFTSKVTGGATQRGLTPFAFYHQGRICGLLDAEVAIFPADSGLVYTDPFGYDLLFDTDNTQYTWLDKSDAGIGLWASTNASELFLVKTIGGGLVVRGDIANPTIVDLPGVASTKGYGALGCSTPLGHVYATRDGVWAWTGGDSVNLLSPQLEGTFWTPDSIDGQRVTNYKTPQMPKGKMAYSYPFVYVGNWCFDIRTKAWWKINSDEGDHVHWECSSTGGVYGFRTHIPAGTGVALNSTIADIYDPSKGTYEYKWLSHPLARTRDRQVVAREVIVKAQGQGTVTVTIIGLGGVSRSVSFTLASYGSQDVAVQRANFGISATDMTVHIHAVGIGVDSPAPRVLSVAVGYQEEQSVRQVN